MMLPQEQKVEQPKSEQLNLVDDDVELTFEPEPVERPEDLKDQKDTEEQDKPEVVDMYNEPVDFRVVEDLPQFPGGASEFMKWLTRNLKYPASAQNKKIKGRVVAQFACDREVLRVLRMMPKWQAGVMNAKPCRTKVCIPIVFNL